MVTRRPIGAWRNHTGVAGVPAWTHDIESRSSMRSVNPYVIPTRGPAAGTGPPYAVGLRGGLYSQAEVALAFEMGEVPRPCVQSQGDIAEESRMPPSRVAARLRSTRVGRIDRSKLGSIGFGVVGPKRVSPLRGQA